MLAWAVRQGHTVAMLTLTARHNRGQGLETLWDGLSGAWRHLGKGWGSESDAQHQKRLMRHEEALEQYRGDEVWEQYTAAMEEYVRHLPKGEIGPNPCKPSKPRKPRQPSGRRIGLAEEHGLLGYVRATEATHGEAGWHVHYHVVMVLDTEALPHGAEDRDEALEALRSGIYRLWRDGLAKSGLSVVDTVKEKDGSISNVGADLRVMHGVQMQEEVSRYLTKTTDAEAGHKAARALAGEATLGQFKSGRSFNRSPFEILGAVVEHGDAEDAALWEEWTRVSRGRRQMVWSRGLREMAGIAAEEQTDEEIAAEEYGDADRLILPRGTWQAIRDTDRRFDLLEALEKGGKARAVRRLDRWGLHYVVCDDRGDPSHCGHREGDVCVICSRAIKTHEEDMAVIGQSADDGVSSTR